MWLKRSGQVSALLTCLWVTAQCASRSRTPTPSQLADLARADALVVEGCYRCLQEALGIYERLSAPGTRPPLDRALGGAFDVSLLLAVREKELGLSADASLTRARVLFPRLSNSVARTGSRSPRVDPSVLLEAVENVAGELSGLDAEERQRRADQVEQRDRMAPTIDRLRQALEASPAHEMAAAYLTLALACEWPPRRSANSATPRAEAGDPPLLRYRRAICSGDRPTSLVALRATDARWTDTLFFEGKYEMGSPARPAEPARAALLLNAASETFSDSLAIRLMLANAQEMNGDFADALASYDRVLVWKPAHVDALLGRVKNLSYLGRADEGIAAAAALIDLGTWHVGEAFYWRAWNAYQTRRLEPAWADVQQALRLLANTSVYALAGSIAYARRELDTASGHFDRAFEIDPSNCLAVWSAGLVHVDKIAWQPAADRFSKATACFATAARSARAELAALDQTALEPAIKARISSARKRAESADELGGQAALHAAQCFLHTNQKSLALTYVELAARHPSTRDKAEALRPTIDGLR